MISPPYRFITTTDEAHAFTTDLQHAHTIGLDTETYFDSHTKRMRLALVQIAYANYPVLVLDALTIDPEPLRTVLEAPGVQMAAHNARFDEGVLVDAGFAPRGFVDTLQLARRALRLASYSLAAVAAELFGESHDKALQKSNWRRRPLTNEQLAYAAQDALLTLRVFEELQRRLDAAGKLDTALRAAQLEPRGAEDRRARTRRTVHLQLDPLTSEEKEIVKELKSWRLAYARAQHTPAYMICADKTLEHLAQAKPTTLAALSTTYGLGEAKIKRFGVELLQALQHAIERQQS